ncbi:hypothetical protein E4K64_16470 [Bradyrhizobium frederickii]|uniref:Uncharacterized protein n=1 Tax=Bradyrhizobium frederickii TaxID=2560054 RepID=A0A4Y9P6Q9_9BRAD|nr:hypothetical protein [Bradyrhizobium frederickii]TFV75297.1 hypothetical protein E4K64_16470 [Bradyrhizobium frederickii]
MGRPPSKFVSDPRHAGEKSRKREDYFTRAELVALEQSWLLGNPQAGKEAFYRWYAETYFGIAPEKIGRAEMERVRQLFRDAKVRARDEGWLKD